MRVTRQQVFQEVYDYIYKGKVPERYKDEASFLNSAPIKREQDYLMGIGMFHPRGVIAFNLPTFISKMGNVPAPVWFGSGAAAVYAAMQSPETAFPTFIATYLGTHAAGMLVQAGMERGGTHNSDTRAALLWSKIDPTGALRENHKAGKEVEKAGREVELAAAKLRDAKEKLERARERRDITLAKRNKTCGPRGLK